MKNRREKRIYLSPPHQSGHEGRIVKEVLDSNWLSTVGLHIDRFEDRIAELFDLPSVMAVQSGTAALHLILRHLGITSGDKVVVSDLTFAASVNPICYQNAIPVFIDSEMETWNMCPDLLAQYLKSNEGDLPKAVILVHLFGVPAKVREIKKICEKYEIPLIEDCAEALGSYVDGIHVGDFGDYAFLSFNGNKLITTSGGGAIIAKNENEIENLLYLSTQAKSNEIYYHHEEIGYNYRMSNVLAGLGLAQLEDIEFRIAKKIEVNQVYRSMLSSVGFDFQPFFDESCYWLTCAINEDVNVSKLIKTLDEEYNVEARPLWKPMHQQPVFSKYPRILNGVSAKLFKSGICFPSGLNLTHIDQDYIGNAVREITSLM